MDRRHLAPLALAGLAGLSACGAFLNAAAGGALDGAAKAALDWLSQMPPDLPGGHVDQTAILRGILAALQGLQPQGDMTTPAATGLAGTLLGAAVAYWRSQNTSAPPALPPSMEPGRDRRQDH